MLIWLMAGYNLSNLSQFTNLSNAGSFLASSAGADLALGVIIVVTLLVFFLVIKKVMRTVLAILLNSILGVGAIVILNNFFSIGIPINAYSLLISLLFGLPGAGTLLILRLFGVPLPP